MAQMFCKIVEQMFYKVAGLGHRMITTYVGELADNILTLSESDLFNAENIRIHSRPV